MLSFLYSPILTSIMTTGKTIALTRWTFISKVRSLLFNMLSRAGRDWGHEEKGTTEDEMAGWHHCLDGHESQWTPGVGDGQGGLACCDSLGRKESDRTERLIWSDRAWHGEWSYLICSCNQLRSLWQAFHVHVFSEHKIGILMKTNFMSKDIFAFSGYLQLIF